MIDIRTLIPTQDFVRHPEIIPDMVEFIKQGNLFTRDAMIAWELENPCRPAGPLNPPVIKIERFEDGKLFLRDGHHRSIALYEGKRFALDESECRIRDWKYQDYLDIVFLYPDGNYMGWVTPFDPLTEIRLPNVIDYKKHVKKLYYTNPVEAENYIRNHKDEYAKTRTVYSIAELAEVYKTTLIK